MRDCVRKDEGRKPGRQKRGRKRKVIEGGGLSQRALGGELLRISKVSRSAVIRYTGPATTGSPLFIRYQDRENYFYFYYYYFRHETCQSRAPSLFERHRHYVPRIYGNWSRSRGKY